MTSEEDLSDPLGRQYRGLSTALRAVRDEGRGVLVTILGGLEDRQLVRAQIGEPRIKKLESIRRNAASGKLRPDHLRRDVLDLVGFRIVCNNVEDVYRVADAVKLSVRFDIRETRDYIKEPQTSGYRALHLIARFSPSWPGDADFPCEIQIRTLAQDTWANLTHFDIYKGGAPPFLAKYAQRLSKLLETVDEMAGDLREEARMPVDAREPAREEEVPHQETLAFIFERAFAMSLPAYLAEAAVGWCVEHGVTRLDHLDELLHDESLRARLDAAYRNNSGWDAREEVLFELGIVAAGRGAEAACQAAAEMGRREREDIDSFARLEWLAELPETFEALVEAVSSSDRDSGEPVIAIEIFKALGALRSCAICEEPIIDEEAFAQAATEHYGVSEDRAQEIEAALSGGPYEIGSWEHPGLCSYHGYAVDQD